MAAVGRPISDDELQAYVDERLDAERRAEIQGRLEEQPELARRATAYQSQRTGLRLAFASHASEPIPPELNLNRLIEARLRQRPVWWRTAAAVALSLGLGAAGGWYAAWPPRQTRTEIAVSLLQQQAFASHAVYTIDPRHPIEMTTDASNHLAQWLSNRLHRTVVPPDLGALGYRLLGGRLVATEHGGASALFVYDDTAGNRLTVLLRPMAPNLYARQAEISQGAVNGCTWIEHGMGYAVVASQPDSALDQVAKLIAGAPG